MPQRQRAAALGGLCIVALLLGTVSFGALGLAVRAQETAPQPGGAAAGTALMFGKHCASCHGADGRASRLRRSHPEIPDFTSSWQAKRSNVQLVTSILEGKGDTMPAFDGALKRPQARALVAYLRTFAPQAGALATRDSGAGSGSEFEEHFTQFRAEMLKLQTQFDDLAAQCRKQATEAATDAGGERSGGADQSATRARSQSKGSSAGDDN
jgi:mono/diheme cytochrome c family protein